jgi:UDP-glucose 4-epimerase
MSILVAGGSGFLGARIVKKFVGRGEKVVCFDAFPNHKAIGDAIEKVTMIKGDVTFIEDIIAAIDAHKISKIINLAYMMGAESDASPHQAIRVNVHGMDNVFEAARLTGVKRVVYASSIAYHGLQSYFGERCVCEEDLGYLPVQTYSATKRLNEYMAGKYAENYGLEIIGLRISIVYGHGRERGLTVWSSHFASNPAVGKKVVIPHHPEQKCSMVYVDDAAEMFCRLALSERVGHPIYLSGGDTVSLGELGSLVRELLPAAEIAFQPSGKEIPLIYLIDSSRFENEFEFKRTTLKDGIKKHIDEARMAAGEKPLER